MRRWGMSCALAVLLAGTVVWALPWFTRDRDVPAGVPSPRALFETTALRVGPGQSACADAVAVDPHARQARVTLATYRRPAGPPLTLTLTGGGYRAVSRLPGGYADNSENAFAIAPPSRAVLARACVRNDGDAPVALSASADRTRSRSVASVDGSPAGASYWLAFYEGRPHSVLHRLPVILQRMTVFRPGIVGRWLLWPLLVLVALGIPVGVLWAWRRGMAEERALADAPTRSEAAPRDPGLACPGGFRPPSSSCCSSP